MARKADLTKHPALAAKNAVRVNVEDRSEWSELTVEQRSFMTVYMDCMDAARACELTGESMAWVEEQRMMSEDFERVFVDVMHEPKRIAEQIAGIMLPMSIIKLKNLIEQDVNKNVQLNAIKHLHQIRGMMPEGAVTGAGNFVNVSVSNFTGGKD
jgi:hypothetical protein